MTELNQLTKKFTIYKENRKTLYKCLSCEGIFKTKQHATRHMNKKLGCGNNKVTKKITCDDCGLKLKNRDSYITHINKFKGLCKHRVCNIKQYQEKEKQQDKMEKYNTKLKEQHKIILKQKDKIKELKNENNWLKNSLEGKKKLEEELNIAKNKIVELENKYEKIIGEYNVLVKKCIKNKKKKIEYRDLLKKMNNNILTENKSIKENNIVEEIKIGKTTNIIEKPIIFDVYAEIDKLGEQPTDKKGMREFELKIQALYEKDAEINGTEEIIIPEQKKEENIVETPKKEYNSDEEENEELYEEIISEAENLSLNRSYDNDDYYQYAEYFQKIYEYTRNDCKNKKAKLGKSKELKKCLNKYVKSMKKIDLEKLYIEMEEKNELCQYNDFEYNYNQIKKDIKFLQRCYK